MLKDQNGKTKEELKNEVLTLALYKSKNLKLCFGNCLSINIPKGNYKFANKLELTIKVLAITFYAIEVGLTILDYFLTYHVQDGTTIDSELDSFNFLDVI